MARLPSISLYLSASGRASFCLLMLGHLVEKSALIAVYSFHLSGRSSSGKMALVGHTGSQAPQSMHSSGWMTRKFAPSQKQSTGQTATQSVYLQLTQGSATTNAMEVALPRGGRGGT